MKLSKWLDDFKLSHKFLLIAVLLVVGIALPVYSLLQLSLQEQAMTERELSGIKPAVMTVEWLKVLTEHRGLSGRWLSGDGQVAAFVKNKASEVSSKLKDLEQVLKTTFDSPKVQRAMEELSRQWRLLEAATASHSVQQSFDEHNRLVKAGKGLLSEILQQSELSYDPQPASYHLVIALFEYAPRMNNLIGQIRGTGANAFINGTASEQERQLISSLFGELDYPLSAFSYQLEVSSEHDANLRQYLGRVRELLAKVDTLRGTLQSELLGKDVLTYSSTQYFNDVTALIDMSVDLGAMLSEELERQLSDRLNALSTSLMLALLVLALFLGVATIGTYWVSTSLRRGIVQAAESAGAITNGQFGVQLDTVRKDEIGELNRALASMAQLLHAASLENRKAVQVQQALDNTSTNVMIADNQRNIVYMNRSVEKMLRGVESELRKALPQFSVDKIVGSSIDSFHKNPAHQAALLEKLSDKYETKIQVAGLHFRLITNPILSPSGERMGTVVEWLDITQMLAEEKRTARILEALNSTSSNVMIADADRKVIYMNKSAEAMLRNVEGELRKSLPQFSVDKIVGSNMDSFHKNPAHQAALLEKLSGKYETQIKVGNLYFRLIANPIFAPSGERIGSVVEWLDRTQEVLAEQEVSALVSAAGRGDFSKRIETKDKQDFMLSIAEGLNTLVSVTDNGLQDIANVLMALSEGDLTKRITSDYEGAFEKLKNYCNDTAKKLGVMISEIREAADTISSATNEIAQGNTDLSSRTEQQAASLEETASSMEELTSTVRLNAENAKQANGLASQAASVASDGGSLIQQVVTTMAAINESAQKINDIIGVIDGIAFQTNILALNAAVEAARAGEQGRGFAVVASEVRTLAQRSANAAKDIKALISDSVKRIEDGNSLVNQSGDTMKDIVNAIKRVNDIMSEIAAASAEQSAGIDEIGKAVTQMDEMTQQNAALVEEAAAASESLQSQAAQLANQVAAFKTTESVLAPSMPMHRAAPPKVADKPVKKLEAGPDKAPKPKKLVKPAPPEEDEWESF